VDLVVGSRSLVLLGPNGAGKTTLLRAIATLQLPTSGDLRLFGLDARGRDGAILARRNIGYQSQSGSFVPTFSVKNVVEYAGWLKGLNGDSLHQRVDEVLQQTRISHLSRRRVSRLSGGEQKRVSIAQALVHAPKVLLLDEPTAALDPEERISLLELLSTLKHQCTIVFSTHNTADVESVADDVVVVDGGQITFTGSVAAFGALADSESDGFGTKFDRAYSRCVRSGDA
jgi:ABC-2 type transport system ATP-binding protein